jgi:hypothetical protein
MGLFTFVSKVRAKILFSENKVPKNHFRIARHENKEKKICNFSLRIILPTHFKL